eukprot:COSAG02_NODE_39654_length_414_cov_1.136508_1_plen_47_part_10
MSVTANLIHNPLTGDMIASTTVCPGQKGGECLQVGDPDLTSNLEVQC